jgi:hypothetical protein
LTAASNEMSPSLDLVSVVSKQYKHGDVTKLRGYLQQIQCRENVYLSNKFIKEISNISVKIVTKSTLGTLGLMTTAQISLSA